jgi:hypothetical protein
MGKIKYRFAFAITAVFIMSGCRDTKIPDIPDPPRTPTRMTETCGWMDAYDFWYGPTGIETPENKRWEHMNNRNLMVAAWGGAGFAYRVMVYPVGLLGLHPGQTIAVCGWDECESLQYVQKHATFDVLGPGGLASRVVIQLPN